MSAPGHNAALRPALIAIVENVKDEEGQWVLLESLCLGIGFLHGRRPCEIASFIELMAERIATGERVA